MGGEWGVLGVPRRFRHQSKMGRNTSNEKRKKAYARTPRKTKMCTQATGKSGAVRRKTTKNAGNPKTQGDWKESNLKHLL